MFFFSYFQRGFRSYYSTADIVIIVDDRMVRTFRMFGDIQGIAFDIYKRLFVWFDSTYSVIP